MKLTFFAKPSFLGNLYPRHFKKDYRIRLGPQIRGKDVADYLGAKHNPTEGFEHDLVIYVKPRWLNRVRDDDWIDVSDGEWLVDLLAERPNIKVIVHTQSCHDYLRDKIKNRIVVIPQQHLNWENAKRTKRKFNTGGYIGSPSPTALNMYGEIGKRLSEIGLKFITCFDYQKREDAVNFYKKIDFLVVGDWKDKSPYKTATRMINAASFGIPSIAYPLIGYKDFEGYYIHANNNDEILVEAEKLKNKETYNIWSNKIMKEAEKYHISNITKLYTKLR